MAAPLAGNDQCCGAAGTYFIDQPEMAAALLHDKMSAIKASGARFTATSNVGCAMQMGAALREAQAGDRGRASGDTDSAANGCTIINIPNNLLVIA